MSKTIAFSNQPFNFILSSATSAAHQLILSGKTPAIPFSRYPVFEAAFWESIFLAAANPQQATQVIDAMAILESEPCVENERVWNNIRCARTRANQSLNCLRFN